MIGRIKKVGAELLFNGIEDGNIHEVIAMLDAGEVNINSQNHNGSTPLHLAVEKGNLDMIKTLLKYGSNPNIQDSVETGNNNSMHLAVSLNMLPVLELFLDMEEPAPDLEMKNTNGFTILHIAAVKGYVDICRVLVDTGKLLSELL